MVGAGGCVVRLAGLYLADRGAHTFWVTRETVPGRPDSYVNLIHYEVRPLWQHARTKQKGSGVVHLRFEEAGDAGPAGSTWQQRHFLRGANNVAC